MILNLCNHDEIMFHEQSPGRHVAAVYCKQYVIIGNILL